jgi:hypothetical protein
MLYDPTKFAQETRTFQKQAYDAAIEKAEKLVKTNKNIRTFRTTRKICNEAYQVFQNKLQTAYSDDYYKDLVELTIMSREKLFFIELNDKVIDILQNAELST